MVAQSEIEKVQRVVVPGILRRPLRRAKKPRLRLVQSTRLEQTGPNIFPEVDILGPNVETRFQDVRRLFGFAGEVIEFRQQSPVVAFRYVGGVGDKITLKFEGGSDLTFDKEPAGL